jgi:hypothetical protein
MKENRKIMGKKSKCTKRESEINLSLKNLITNCIAKKAD